MRAAIACALMALTMTTASAAEDTNSANYMLPACKAFLDGRGTSDIFVQGMCAGMIKAIAFLAGNTDIGFTALSGEGQVRALKQRWRCADIPDGVTVGQEVRVVISYIEARPKRMHEPFHSLALEALLDAWPCRN
jgi:Rap1a immunity proteins